MLYGDVIVSTEKHVYIWQARSDFLPFIEGKWSKTLIGKVKNAITQTFDNIAAAFAVPAFA